MTRTENGPKRRALGFLLAPVLAIGLAACDTNDASSFSNEDAAAIRDQIEQVADRLDAVEQRLMDMSAGNDGDANEPAQLISEVREVRDDVGEAKNMLTEVSQRLADEEAEEVIEDDAVDPAPGVGAPAIGDDVNQLGDDVQQGIDDVGQDLRDGADDVRDGAAQMGEDLREGAEELGQDVRQGVDDLNDGANDAIDGAQDAVDDAQDSLNEAQDELDDATDPNEDPDLAPDAEEPLVPNAPAL